jgi:hypothetical protein
MGDTWSPVWVAATSADSVASVKSRALATQHIGPERSGEYEVKLGGARVADESATLASLGVRDGAALIVQALRRRPVR